MNTKTIFLILVVGLALLFVGNGLYIVSEYQKAIKLEFGAVSETDIQPGLHWKWPFVNQVRKFDARILTTDKPAARFFTSEQKALMVDYFAKWRVSDPVTYYTANSGSEDIASGTIDGRIDNYLRIEFGKRTLQEVVSGERDELMAAMINEITVASHQELGIDIVDVRVKRIDLPDEVGDSVYNRMRAEREQEAREYRSKGREQAEVIRADADRQKTILEAEAYSEAEKLRGEGDAQAAAIYASAYNKNPEFYSFVRSLTAYKETFRSKGDVLLVDPKSDFFRYLNNVELESN